MKTKYKKLTQLRDTVLPYLQQPHIIALLIIVVVGIVFRFYDTPQRYGFDFDPSRDGLIVLEGVKHLRFPLIGPPSGLGPFTFGPWYYYQLILFELLVPLAFAPWIFIGLSSVATIVIMYKIGETLDAPWFGILLAYLTALTPAQTGPTQGLSNPNLIPFYAAVCVWIFVLFMKRQPRSWLALLWGLAFGIGINSHYQMAGLLLLPIVLFILKKESRIKRILLFSIGLVITFIPLLLFNLQTDWYTVKGLLFYLNQGSHGMYIPNSWRIYVGDFWPKFWSYVIGGVPVWLGVVLGVLSIGMIGYALLRKELNKIYWLLFVMLGTLCFLLRYYSGPREYYYFLFLQPLLLLFFGAALWQLGKIRFGKIIIACILLSMLPFTFYEDLSRLAPRSDFLEFQHEAETLIHAYPNQSIAVYSCNPQLRNQTQGIAFFLARKNKLAAQGVAIGITDKACSPHVSGQRSIPLQTNLAISLSSDQRTSSSWELITPKTVYDRTLTWWKH